MPDVSLRHASTAELEVEQRLASLLPGWTVVPSSLQRDAVGCAFAALHPASGVALFDPAPARTPAAAALLAQRLVETGFADRFGALPPIAAIPVPPDDPGVPATIATAFVDLPPMTLAPDSGWVAAVRSALTAPASPVPKAAMRGTGARALIAFWAILVAILAGGGVLLTIVGPPDTHHAPAVAAGEPDSQDVAATVPSGATEPAATATAETQPPAVPAAPTDAPPAPSAPTQEEPAPHAAGTLPDVTTEVPEPDIPADLLPTPDEESAEAEHPEAPAEPAGALPDVPTEVLEPEIADVPSAPGPAPTTDAAPPPDQPIIAALLHRGADILATGDVSGARLLFERAAGLGSGAAALALGRSYDPEVLSELGTIGLQADVAEAVRWYRIAAERGEAEAEGALVRLDASR